MRVFPGAGRKGSGGIDTRGHGLALLDAGAELAGTSDGAATVGALPAASAAGSP